MCKQIDSCLMLKLERNIVTQHQGGEVRIATHLGRYA